MSHDNDLQHGRPQPDDSTLGPNGSPRPSAVVAATLMAASMLTIMAGATVAPALPGMRDQFADTDNVALLVRLVLTVPALFIAVGAPLAGLLIDRVGRKPVLLTGVLVYGLAGGSGLVLDNLWAILAGRALLGIAVAGIMISATALIADYYPEPLRSRVLGLQAAFMGFGGVVFLSLGGVLAESSWRGPFWIYLAALVLVPFVLSALKEPARAATNTSTATDSPTGNQRRGIVALLAGLYGLGLVGMVVFYTVPTQLPFYLDELGNVGPAGSGLAIAVMTLAQAIMGMLYGRIRSRLGFHGIAVLTFVLITAGFAALGLAGGALVVVLPALVVGGLGVGLLIPNLNSWLVTRTPGAMRGRALSGVTAAIFLGQFLSPVITQPLLLRVDIAGIYLLAAAVAAVTAVAALVATAAVRARRGRTAQ